LLDCLESEVMSVKRLDDLSRDDLVAFVDSFDSILCDCDGVLYKSDQILLSAPELITYLAEEKGKKVFYVSNNAVKTRQQYVDGLTKKGFPIKKVIIWLIATLISVLV